MIGRIILSSVLTVLLAGCASQPSYQEQLDAMPVPQSEQERQEACAQLRSEIGRMHSISDYGSLHASTPTMALLYVAKARQNVAAIESKAAEFRCSAAFAERLAPSGIEACVATCKANTSRSPEQCFDVCNK